MSSKRKILIFLTLFSFHLHATLAQNCTPPPTPFISIGTFCGCSQAIGRASRNVAVTGKTFEWYADSTRQVLLPSRMSLEGDVSLYETQKNETVWVFEKENNCYSVGQKVNLRVFTAPNAPPSVPNNSIFSCGSGTLTATPKVSGNIIEWWGTPNQTPGTRLGEGNSYTSMRTRNAFVHEVSRNNCDNSQLSCYSVPIPVDFNISPPMTVDINVSPTVCPDGTVTLIGKPMGGTSPYAYNWSGAHFEQQYTVSRGGEYILRARDIAGCEAYDTVKVIITCRVTAINEKNEAFLSRNMSLLSLFPNPAFNILTVKMNSKASSKAEVFSFYDAQGRLLLSEKRPVLVGENVFTFECQFFSAGLIHLVTREGLVGRFSKM